MLVASELIASRATGVTIDAERIRALKEHLFRLSGCIIFGAAGATLRYFGG